MKDRIYTNKKTGEPVELDDRERLIVDGIRLRSLKNREIADEIGTSEQNIKSCLTGIYSKFGVSGRPELANHIRNGETNPIRITLIRRLSDTQFRVARYVGQGKSNADIATILGVKERSLEGYLSDIYNITGAMFRGHLAEMARQGDICNGFATFVEFTPIDMQLIAFTKEDKPKTNAEIARIMNTTENTVKVYFNELFKKVGVSSSIELAGLDFGEPPPKKPHSWHEITSWVEQENRRATPPETPPAKGKY